MEVTHKDIYDRLVAVESKVVDIDNNTKGLVSAFQAAQSAFIVLEWIAKIAKPILWIGGVIGMLSITWSGFTKK
jgi:hypothetical protein